jgi:DNA-directed RNA polymerase specialized sigma24 family protein
MTLDELTVYVSQRSERWHAEALRRLGDADAADEAVQLTYLQLLRHHESIDAENPDGYARTVLTNVIVEAHRARARERRAGRVSYSETEAERIADPESFDEGDPASVAECERLVRGALAALTPLERTSMRLFLSGVSRADALRQLGGGYDGALFRARQKVNDHLDRQSEVVLRLGLERLVALLGAPEGGRSADDTAIVSASDTTVLSSSDKTRGSVYPGNPFPYQELLDYARGRGGDAAKRRIDRQLKADPRWRAHLESVRYLDLEQLAARQDGEALAHFGPDQRTPFCRHVARSAGQVLLRLSSEGEALVEGLPRDDWEKHALDCVYCRRVQRLAHAELARRGAGLGEGEPLLRDWLLGRHYRDRLERVTKELGGAPLPFPTAAAPAPEPATRRQQRSPSLPPDDLTEVALAALRGTGPRSALTQALAPAVAAYVLELDPQADQPALVARCSEQIEATLPQWDPQKRSVTAWALEVCRRCCGRAAPQEAPARAPLPRYVLAEEASAQGGVERLAGEGAFAGTILLDMSDVDPDSVKTGLFGTLTVMLKRAQDEGGRIVLTNLPPELSRLLDAVGLLGRFAGDEDSP